MHDFRRLRVWQAAFALAISVYELSRSLPTSERFGLASQMQRAAVSIPANIAEGADRGSSREYARYVSIACGSAGELLTHLMISREVHGLECSDHCDSTQDIINMLSGLRRTLVRSG